MMFTRIMNFETTKEELKEEFEGNSRVKFVRPLAVKRQFDILKIKDERLCERILFKANGYC